MRISEKGFGKIKGLDRLILNEEGKLHELFSGKMVTAIEYIDCPFTFFVKMEDNNGWHEIIERASSLEFKPNAYFDSDVASSEDGGYYDRYAKSVLLLKVKYEENSDAN